MSVRVRFGHRVAIFDDRDELWFPAYVTRIARGTVTLRFDDPTWSDFALGLTDDDCPPVLVFRTSPFESSMPSADLGALANSSISDNSDLDEPPVPVVLLDADPIYRGVTREGFRSWLARIWRDGCDAAGGGAAWLCRYDACPAHAAPLPPAGAHAWLRHPLARVASPHRVHAACFVEAVEGM